MPYTETGGAFPVTFNSRSDTSEEVRVGLDAELPISGRTRLLRLVAGVHRLGGDPSNVRGSIGQQSFSLPDSRRNDTWGGPASAWITSSARVAASRPT